MCTSRPTSIGRFTVKPAPYGVTSTRRVISVHSISTASRQRIRTGSEISNRSRMRFVSSLFRHVQFEGQVGQTNWVSRWV